MTSRRRMAGMVSAAALMLAVGTSQAHAEPAAALLPGNQIVTFDTATPQNITGPIPVTGLGSTHTLRGVDFRPGNGQLFGVAVITGSASNSPLFSYAIDPVTGVATFVGQATFTVASASGDIAGDIDFNPAVDRIRYVSVNDENARVNPNNGAIAGDDNNINGGAFAVVGVAYDRNTVFEPALGMPAPAGTQTTAYTINRTGSSVGTLGGINASAPGGPNGGTVASIGSLGVTLDAGRDAGFDISPSGATYAALTVGGVTSLYTIGLPNTRATAVGPIGDGASEVYGLTVATDADGDGLVFIRDNCPAAANADQADLDGDGVGDACDPDQDGDGLSDAVEAAIGSDPRSANSDGDGVADGADACPVLAGTQPNGCPDIALPETTITKGPKKKTTKTTAKFSFESSEPGSTFACSLDGKAFKPCKSPQKYKNLKPGKHEFEARAIDAAKNLDPTPASRSWTVKD